MVLDVMNFNFQHQLHFAFDSQKKKKNHQLKRALD